MIRGFGIDATVAPGVAATVARRAEEAGYGSFWVNGSPPAAAIESLAAAAETSDLPLGVGVLPLTSIEVHEIVSEVRRVALPQNRLWLGIGSARSPGALTEVRRAVETLRTELDVTLVLAAVGPRMTELAGELADAVLFTWWPRDEVVASRRLLEIGATRVDRETPPVASYVRVALLPEAAAELADKADLYAAIPRYAAVFSRNDVEAADTVVTGGARADLLPGIERESEVLDVPIIRAIAGDAAPSIIRLLEAAAPA